LLQLDAMGVDVAVQQGAKHKNWLSRLFKHMTPLEMEATDPKSGKRFCSAEQAAEVLAVRASVEGKTQADTEVVFRKAIDAALGKWMVGRKESILESARNELAKCTTHKPFKKFISDFSTEFLLKRLPEINPAWSGHLKSGAEAVKAVFAERAAGGRSRPHYAILRDLEKAEDDRKRHAEFEKMAAEQMRHAEEESNSIKVALCAQVAALQESLNKATSEANATTKVTLELVTSIIHSVMAEDPQLPSGLLKKVEDAISCCGPASIEAQELMEALANAKLIATERRTGSRDNPSLEPFK
jgi:hypothetical protein